VEHPLTLSETAELNEMTQELEADCTEVPIADKYRLVRRGRQEPVAPDRLQQGLETLAGGRRIIGDRVGQGRQGVHAASLSLADESLPVASAAMVCCQRC